MIHRHLGREWESQDEVMGIIFKKLEILVTLEDLFICEIQERKGDQILFQNSYCFGASWSKLPVELLEHGSPQDCSLGLLHCFGFSLILLFDSDLTDDNNVLLLMRRHHGIKALFSTY